MDTALLKADGRKVRVTVLGPYCRLNWSVRLEEDCAMGGRPLKAGATYIAGKSQLIFQANGSSTAPAPEGSTDD